MNAMNYAAHIGYSDINPFEIVRHVSDKTVEIREMNAERDPEWNPEFVPGGFSAVCTNNRQQRWVITSQPDGRTFRIRKHADGRWLDKYGAKYILCDKPVKFYDYNF